MKTANKAIAAGAAALIVALAAAAAVTLYYARWQWKPRAEAEVHALEADAGSLMISDLAPKAPPAGTPNPAVAVEDAMEFNNFQGAGSTEWLKPPRDAGALSSTIFYDSDPAPEELDFADPGVKDAHKEQAAFEQLPEWRGIALAQDPAQREWNAGWARYVGRELAAQKAVVAPARKLADAGAGVFMVDWNARAADTYHLQRLHECAALMHLEALDMAAAGRMKEAFASVRRCMRLRRIVDDEPCPESKRCAIEIDAMAFSGLQAAFEFSAPDKESAEALFDELADREMRNDAWKALVGDTVRLHNRLRETLAATQGGGASSWEQYKWEYLRLRALREARERLRAEPARPLPAAQATEGAAGKPDPHLEKVVNEARALVLDCMESTAQARMARTVIALVRYKAEHKAYPEAVDALVPEYCDAIETDPFVDEALVYRREKDGFVLYSIGPDETDNGGTPKRMGNSPARHGDIVWRRLK